MKDNLPLYQKASAAYLLIAIILPEFYDINYCYFKRFTGLPCPGCGLTHSLHSLLTFQFREAFLQHPFGAPILPVLVFFISTIFWKKGAEIFYSHEKKINLLFLLGGSAFLLYGIYRIAVILY